MRSRSAFTLTDLLVVIAVVAMLNLLLIQVVQHWRENAARAECANNLKHIALGYNNWRTALPAKAGTFPVETWTTSLAPYFETNANVLLCPKAPPSRRITGNGVTGAGTGGGVLLSTGTVAMTATASANTDPNWMPQDVLNSRHQNCLTDNTFTCNSCCGTGWYPGSATGSAWWQVDLKSSMYITGLMLWNWNDANGANNGTSPYPWGAKSVTFNTSDDGVKLSEWSYSTTLPQAPFTAQYDTPTSIAFSGNSAAKYLRITIHDSFSDVPALARVGLYAQPCQMPIGPTSYGMNYYLALTRRVSNTSGTILALDYDVPIANMAWDGDLNPFYQRGFSFVARSFATNVAPRHPASVAVNVAFVDGHVDTLKVNEINPSTVGDYDAVGNTHWNNYCPRGD